MTPTEPSLVNQLRAVLAKLLRRFYIRQERSLYLSAQPLRLDEKMADCNPEGATPSSSRRAQQYTWAPVVNREEPQLRLYNSFTRTTTPFHSIDGNRVKFYICGPTVYDQAHMGHARAYLSFDIVRRVLSHYFKYDLLYVMNITDIDDKIIKRARQTYLYEAYVRDSAAKKFTDVASDVYSSLKLFRQRVEIEADPEKQKMLNEMARRVHDAITRQEQSLKQYFQTKGSKSQVDDEVVERAKTELVADAKDILAEWLDDSLGSTINEHSVFSKLARKYENDFLQDMRTLDVLQPDILTRVSEYIPEIIDYVKRIIHNGYAYVAKEGSVYFDTAAFDSKPNHHYAKLVPEAYGDAESAAKHLRESEGELSVGAEKLQEKRSPSDFALWKSSKAGEPYWDSPWGRGRPGWHIECSAMSQAICGPQLDIHAGGFDLKFPHHDNEVAQCEAYMDSASWVNYFLHCGTLRIAGSKMSKSLKNFISIKQALREYTSRQLRLLFLMHQWTDSLDYSASTMERVMQFERSCQEFFLAVKDLHRRHVASCFEEAQAYRKYSARDIQLLEEFQELKAAIHDALCNSIDTREAVEKMREMITAGNKYIMEMEKSPTTPANSNLLTDIARYITSMLQMFGVIPAGHQHQQIGFPTEENGSMAGIGAESKEELIMPYLAALADFREVVRRSAREQKNLEILQECDNLRDKVLPELGVRLEDKSSNQTCVKLVDRQTLLREQEQKEKMAEAKVAEKLMKQKLKEEQEAQRELKKRQKEELKAKQQQQKKVAPKDNTTTGSTTRE